MVTCTRGKGSGYDPDPKEAGHEGACSKCHGHGEVETPEEYWDRILEEDHRHGIP